MAKKSSNTVYCLLTIGTRPDGSTFKHTSKLYSTLNYIYGYYRRYATYEEKNRQQDIELNRTDRIRYEYVLLKADLNWVNAEDPVQQKLFS